MRIVISNNAKLRFSFNHYFHGETIKLHSITRPVPEVFTRNVIQPLHN